MKVLFLDIDGVVVTARSHFTLTDGAGGWRNADPLAIALLERLVDNGVKIVISSTWRLMSRKDLDDLLGPKIVGALHEDWATPDLVRKLNDNGLYAATIRGEEIADWLSRHPEVESYKILDDDQDMTPEQMPHFLKCDGEDGGGIGCKAMHALLVWSGDYVWRPKEEARSTKQPSQPEAQLS